MARFVVGDTVHANRDAAILDIVDRNEYVNVTCREYVDGSLLRAKGTRGIGDAVREWHVTDIDDGDLRILAVFNPEYRASLEDIVHRKPVLKRAIEARRRFNEQFEEPTTPTREKRCPEEEKAPKRRRWWARILKACRSHCCACCVPSTEAFAPAATSMPSFAPEPYTTTTCFAPEPYTTTTYSAPQPYLASFG